MDGGMKPTVLVLGSGPIRIGQGIEFDYSCVHCMWALQEMGHRAVVINNNPETVSTDFDTGDGLYFEPVTLRDVLQVVQHEQPVGVMVQFGGQTAINLAEGLHQNGVPILGTSFEAIALAEDRHQFEALLSRLEIPKPPGWAVTSLDEAKKVAAEVGYPVLVRPSFVLGGRAMEIVYREEDLEALYREAEDANPGQPVLIDQYFLGTEAEIDVISDGEATLVPGIMEHIERAGVHSGDSMAVYPCRYLSENVQAQMVRIACDLARAIQIRGIMNIQFVIQNETAYVIEVNPRASRTVPYLSKVTGVPMVALATQCAMGQTLAELGYESGLWWLDPSSPKRGRVIPEEEFRKGPVELPVPRLYAVKAPVFSFQKLTRVEPSLGPEMKSTGEILGIDRTYEAAIYKALVASGIHFRQSGLVVLTVNDRDKSLVIPIARQLQEGGFALASTGGTHDALTEAGIPSVRVQKIQEGSPHLLDMIMGGEVSLMVNTPGTGQDSTQEAARIRRACIESGVPCITNIDTAGALAQVLDYFQNPEKTECLPYPEYLKG